MVNSVSKGGDLAVVRVVQRLQHYIVLRKQPIVVIEVNPFQYVFTRRLLRGKYNKWIVILQGEKRT
jgi:hypothetical protein